MRSLVTYLINLDSSAERLDAARAQLDAAGMAFQRVPAFDGRKLDPNELPEYDAQAAMAYMGRPLRGGEIGCYFSHIECLKRFLHSDSDLALVLEDDFTLADGMAETLEAALDWLEGQQLDFDVININPSGIKYTSHLNAFGAHCLFRAHYFPMRTMGLVWTRHGAAAFIAQQGKIFAPIDNLLREWQSEVDRGLAIWPPLVEMGSAPSEIDGAGARRDREGRSLLYGWAKQKRIWRNKWRARRNRARRRA